MANRYRLNQRQYQELCRQEIRSVVNYFKYGGFEESMRIADFFEVKRRQIKDSNIVLLLQEGLGGGCSS